MYSFNFKWSQSHRYEPIFAIKTSIYYKRLFLLYSSGNVLWGHTMGGATSFIAGLLVLTQPETLGTKLPDTLSEAEALGRKTK